MKRLWKHRVVKYETTSSISTEFEDDLEVKSTAQSMLKRLKENQLEALVQSVECKGGETTECVLMPKGDLRLGKRTVSPQILCCQLWRWPDIDSDIKMKRLPCCLTIDDPMHVCCNPHHWSLLLDTGKVYKKPDRRHCSGAAIFLCYMPF